MKGRALFYLITLVSTSLFALLQFIDPAVIKDNIESKTYDLRLHLRRFVMGQGAPPGDIVIVAVDEKSIREIGGWPWGRDVLAKLIQKISSGGPKAIGVDIILSEKKPDDERLVRAFEEARNVVLATPFIVPEGEKRQRASSAAAAPDYLWDAAFMEVKSVKGIDWRKWAIIPDGVLPPLEYFAKVTSLGHVWADTDMDGVIRWEPLYLNYGDDCYPQFALQIGRVALGLDAREMVLYGGSGVKLGGRFISTDLHGRVLINYLGKAGSFSYTAASDVINDRLSAGFFKDKVVLVGTSAIATFDQKVTPLSGNMPGVEKNANTVRNILMNNFLRPSPRVVELVTIIVTGILFGFFLPRLKAIPSALLAAGFISFYVALGCLFLFYRGFVIGLVYPLSNMAGIFVVQTVIRFFFEERKARVIRQMFSSYVSPKIVRELIDNPDKAKLGGERRTVTVLFADVIGFTSLSERRQPEEVVSLLNEYFKVMAEVIFKWDGTLDKIIGDEIMVFWGAPVDQPNHAERAVRCALDMSERLNELQKKWNSSGAEGLDCGIGINTGEVIIGNIGAQGKKMDYTAIGDHINLGARVEKLTRQYGTRILITENTYREILSFLERGAFGHCEITEVDTVKVKGKENEIRIFRVAGGPHTV
jgi:adenylate cyclase